MRNKPMPELYLAHLMSNEYDIAREFPNVRIQDGMEIECWGTPFSYKGGDFCILVLNDENGNKIESKRVSGY